MVSDFGAAHPYLFQMLVPPPPPPPGVIAYASHSLSHSGRKWCTYDREIWAVVWSVRRFNTICSHLTSRLSQIHKPLTGLRKMSITHHNTGRRSRSLLELDPFNWTIIEHRDGIKHANADALSRVPVVSMVPDTAVVVQAPNIVPHPLLILRIHCLHLLLHLLLCHTPCLSLWCVSLTL